VAAAAVRLAAAVPRRADYLMVPEVWGRVRIITPAFVRAAASRGKKVFVWTVNDPDAALRLAQAGVDGIVTDYPARMASVLE
jgi:glycerophosphoryl diester phosphodiesterase